MDDTFSDGHDHLCQHAKFGEDRTTRAVCRCENVFFFVTRLDALALSVIATATWLAGWLGGWLSHSGIVSKPLYVSENFFDHLKAPSFYFSVTPASIQNSRRNPFVECVKYRGGGMAIVV